MDSAVQAAPLQLSAVAQPGPVAFAVLAPPRVTAPPPAGTTAAAPSGRPAAGGFAAWAAWGGAGAVAAALSRRSRRRVAATARAAAAGPAEARLEEGALPGRASLLRGLGASCAGAVALPGLAPEALALSPDEARTAAKKYGVPDMLPADINKKLPDGWRVLVEPIGLAKDASYGRFNLGSEPLVVEFYVPSGWIVSRPNYDFNGSAGTVQANDYGKGDATTLWVDTNPKIPLKDMKKKDLLKELKRAITVKGSGGFDDIRINKMRDEGDYKIVQFDWEIYTGAGLLISRDGWASFCQVGDEGNIQLLWSGVVSNRWRKMEDELKTMIESFRVAKVPKDVAAQFLLATDRGEEDVARGII